MKVLYLNRRGLIIAGIRRLKPRRQEQHKQKPGTA
jgi:hypothetical protein